MKLREVAMVEVVMVEASARHSAETCSAGHGSKPRCIKPASRAAHGHTAMEAAAAVETRHVRRHARKHSSASTQGRLPSW